MRGANSKHALHRYVNPAGPEGSIARGADAAIVYVVNLHRLV